MIIINEKHDMKKFREDEELYKKLKNLNFDKIVYNTVSHKTAVVEWLEIIIESLKKYSFIKGKDLQYEDLLVFRLTSLNDTKIFNDVIDSSLLLKYEVKKVALTSSFSYSIYEYKDFKFIVLREICILDDLYKEFIIIPKDYFNYSFN